LLDCQATTLQHLNTRVVVPLLPPDEAPYPGARLNPHFEIEGAPYVMVTQFIASVPVGSLGEIAVSLEEEAYDILNALDMLLTGV
jgi:toxin CcdB